MTVISLQQLDEASRELAGGKGANLGELCQADFPVPPGFVVGADEYAAVIESLNLPGSDAPAWKNPDYLERLREMIVDSMFNEQLTSGISREIEAIQAQRASPVVFAVRSSATKEDLADASFAGQHETYYYVSADQVPVMIRKCWASLWADAAFSYRNAQGIEHRDVHMAVVVQEIKSCLAVGTV